MKKDIYVSPLTQGFTQLPESTVTALKNFIVLTMKKSSIYSMEVVIIQENKVSHMYPAW